MLHVARIAWCLLCEPPASSEAPELLFFSLSPLTRSLCCATCTHEMKEEREVSRSFALVFSAAVRKNSVGLESLVRIKDKVDLLTSALPVCNAHLFFSASRNSSSSYYSSHQSRSPKCDSFPFFTLGFFFFKSHSISVSLHLPPLLLPCGSSLKRAARKRKEE